MNRRAFLMTGAAAALPLQAQAPVRKSVNKMTAATPELQKYAKAIDLMKKLPASDPRNWNSQAKIHDSFCPHRNWWFLPWHRAYLFYFESVCRDVLKDPSFALPYWDWSTQFKIPAPFLSSASPLFNPTRQADTVSGTILGPARVRALIGRNGLIDIFSGATTTDDQRQSRTQGELESGPHNHVHATILGDMGSFMSPLDPLFWMHHCNIDRIWASWSKIAGHAAPTAPTWLNHKLTEFWDPDKKAKATPLTSSTTDVNAYRALYDAFETPVVRRPAQKPLNDFTMMAPMEAPPPAGLKKWTASVQPPAAAPAASARASIAVGNNLAAFAQRASQPVPPQIIYLYVENVPVPENPATALRVFLQKPEASNSTATTDPTFVGTISFFGADHGGQHGNVDTALNVTDTLAKLITSGVYKANTPVDVTLVAVDNRNPRNPVTTRSVRPGRIRLSGLEGM